MIQAAREVYDAGGYGAVTMRAVAARLGLSAAALYRYFDNHRELIRAMWLDAVTVMQAQAEQVAAACDDPLDRVRSLLRSYLVFARSHPAAFRSTFLQVGLPAGPDAEVFDREGRLPGVDLREASAYRVLRRAVGEAQASGRLPAEDPELVTQVLWGAVHGCVALEFNFGPFPLIEAERRFERTLSVLLEGLGAGATSA